MKEENFEKIKKILEKEPKLIEIKTKEIEKIIFVGDTHGDFEASQKVIKEYLGPKNIIVFLGDYVDRGPYSKENFDFLLEKKMAFPKQIYLLQGNHEAYHILEFLPADFWQNLSSEEHEKYCLIAEKLPLAAITEDILALHGGLPDIGVLKEINKIKVGGLGYSELREIERSFNPWFQIAWGNFIDAAGEYLGINPLTGRPEFGKDWFCELMNRFNKKVLIRSHQPTAPLFMFDDRCLTIFTSSAYKRERIIAILDLKKPIKNAKDLKILKI